MERLERTDKRENFERQHQLEQFVEYLSATQDADLAYFALTLHHRELDRVAQAQLVGVLIANVARNNTGREAAFNALRDLPELDGRLKENLLQAIVKDADQTTCSLVHSLVPHLGEWEEPLRKVLAE
jgi:hypothetical protein